MKKLILPILFLFISFASNAQRSIVKVNASALTNRIFSVAFEQKVSKMSSIQLNVDYSSEKDEDFGFHSKWFGFSGEYRMYGLLPALGKSEALEGFYVAPTVGLRFFKDIDLDDPNSEYTERYSFIQAGAHAGYQYLPQFKNGKKPLTLEASVGLLGGFMTKGLSEDFDDYTLGSRFKTGIVPTFNIGIGLAFGK